FLQRGMRRHGIFSPYTYTPLNNLVSQVSRGARLVSVFLSNFDIGRSDRTFVFFMTSLAIEREHSCLSFRLIRFRRIDGRWLLDFSPVIGQTCKTGILVFRKPAIAIFQYIDKSVGPYFHIHGGVKLR